MEKSQNHPIPPIYYRVVPGKKPKPPHTPHLLLGTTWKKSENRVNIFTTSDTFMDLPGYAFNTYIIDIYISVTIKQSFRTQIVTIY